MPVCNLEANKVIFEGLKAESPYNQTDKAHGKTGINAF